MKKGAFLSEISYCDSRFYQSLILYFALLFFSNNLFSQSVENGEQLYKVNCTSCHAIDKKLIGPALAGVNDKYSQEWLIKWIKNSAEMIADGDPQAIAIWEEYNKSPMTSFLHLSDEEIIDILSYIEEAPNLVQTDNSSSVDTAISVVDESSSNYYQLVIFLVLILFVAGLWKVKNMLKVAADEQPKDIVDNLVSYISFYLERTYLVVATIVLLAIGGANAAWNIMTGIGVYQEYAPEQPIKFSHKLHAGENGVDCNYCHSSARHSKHSGIPSANVCMNCHTYINEGPSGTAEIQKIYDAVGFDPKKGQYIEGYEEKPIKWVRIHNLPDLAYFNHSQHVVAGGLECQDCHGPVEEMEVLYQYSELTMGWCINCHRETEVQAADNDYYEEMHKKFLENHPDQKFTVEEIGGLECGKCHY